ncbi:MAG: ABC transporter ATP-binding protein [Anaerolineae bacterium]
MTSHSLLSTQHPVLSTSFLTIGYTAPRRAPKVVVEDINVSLKAGELVCLIGPNGAGKSTLMRTLAGMQAPLSGSVQLLGDDVRSLKANELAKRLSIVLTEKVDVGVLSAYALVALGRYPYTGWMGDLTAEDEAVVRQAMSAVGAAELAARNINELSDGERQKVMIARALAQEPAVLLLDEPTAYLDLPRRAEMLAMLRELARTTGKAILLSTHDLDLALRNADCVWLLPKGGRLQVGAPEDLILSGAFEAAFRGEGVMFDTYTGSFKTSTPPAGTIDLHGDGLPALWTVRALEREGYCVVRWGTESPTKVEVDLLKDGQTTGWQVTTNGVTTNQPSLYALVEYLRQTVIPE